MVDVVVGLCGPCVIELVDQRGVVTLRVIEPVDGLFYPCPRRQFLSCPAGVPWEDLTGLQPQVVPGNPCRVVKCLSPKSRSRPRFVHHCQPSQDVLPMNSGEVLSRARSLRSRDLRSGDLLVHLFTSRGSFVHWVRNMHGWLLYWVELVLSHAACQD